METLIIAGIAIMAVLAIIFLYCGMVVAAKDDEETQKLMQKINGKKRGDNE